MSPSKMLPSNESILRARFPVVFKRIIESGSRMPDSFMYEDQESGPVLMSIRGEHIFPSYGIYNKNQLLKRWFEALKLAPESLYAVTGFGDGSHLKYLMENSTSGTNLLAAERDPALVRETLARYDLSKLLANDRFALAVGEPDDDYFRDIQGAALTNVMDVNMVVFAPLHLADEQYYDRTRNELLRQYLVIRPLMEVNVRTATDIQTNTLENIPHMARSPDIGLMENEFKDIPFILIGAGPSLDESINFLKAVQDKAIIVSSNSPFRKLINSGIRPHLVVTADPMAPTLAGFENVSLENVPLACPFSAYPEIVRRFSGRILSWCTFNPVVDVLKTQMGLPSGTTILEQGTVSGCVLDLSRLFGCRKVLLVGQDMSVRDDGRYYTDDSSYSDTGSHFSSTDKGQRLPGNTQEKVLVEGRLFVYLKTFEQFIAKQQGIEYRNLARTGVRINGAPYQTYEEALQWIGDSDSRLFDQRVSQLLAAQGDTPDLETIFSPVRKYVEHLFEESLSVAVQSELLPKKFAGTNYSNQKQVKELLARAGKINALIDSNKAYWNFLFEGKTKGELVSYRRRIRDIDFPNKEWASIQRNKEYFWSISEGANWLLQLMDNKLCKTEKAGHALERISA